MTDRTYDNVNNGDLNNTGTYDYDRYYGKVVVDNNGDKVGDVGQVYLDDATSRPEWVTVRTGLFGTKETFVPLQGENFEGDTIRVPYSKDQIKGAPSIDPNGHISESEEDELYRYYSLNQDRVAGNYDTRDRVATGVATDRDVTDRDRVADVNRDANLGRDGEVVRHEERLNVGTERVEAGRVRIRKHVVNEQQSVSVPVTHEEVRVERTPIVDGRADGTQLSEGETEVVLHEERPVVSKETVGVEKIAVGTEQVTENQTVSANVAKEQVDVVQDGTVRDDRLANDGTVRDGNYGTDGVRDNRSFTEKVKDKLDRDNDGHIG